MTTVGLLPDLDRSPESTEPTAPSGRGLLTSERGNLPLVAMVVEADVTGLLAAMTVRQTFANPHNCPIEATYIFPLPDRAAVTDLTVTIGNRRITGVLQERQAARDTYDQALAAGQRAALVEEDRPDVFTTRIGNLGPGEQATVELTLAGPVPCELGEATFRVPLVVAPRYIPGSPLDGVSAGQGTALDTDAVPDASRITPPRLVPGGTNRVRLSLTVRLDPAGMTVGDLRSSLHAVTVAGELPGPVTIAVHPGERLDRDFILRYRTTGGQAPQVSALAVPDSLDGAEGGTYVVTVMPPAGPGTATARDVVLLLDRSGSMGGWKMVAARRAAARIVDSLTSEDRFAVLAFDHEVQRPDSSGPDGSRGDGLVAASDRNRYQAVEWLGRLEARGGTEMAAALRAAHSLVAGAPEGNGERARSCILVTDGQVGDEDQLVRLATDAGVRMFTVGIDQAVNAGLLRRLAAVTGGRCDLVESEDRLDGVLADLRRRIGPPVLESVSLRFEGLTTDEATRTPARPADLYPGVPLVMSGRFRGPAGGRVVVAGGDGTTMSGPIVAGTSRAAAPVWARAHLRDLEDRYAALTPRAPGAGADGRQDLAAEIIAVSLRYQVLCRFTGWVAVDQSGELVEGAIHRIVQPVEQPAGWAAPSGPVTLMAAPMAAPMEARPAGPPNVTMTPGSPYQPPPSPGSLPPTRATGPRALRRAPRITPYRGGSGYPPAQSPPPTISLASYRGRLEELLDAIDGLADPVPTGERRRLATAARLLAGDIASVVDASIWADLFPAFDALLAALAAGSRSDIRARGRLLGAAMAGEEQPRPAGTEPFWR
jgi:Ca-activated chloride channel homolog